MAGQVNGAVIERTLMNKIIIKLTCLLSLLALPALAQLGSTFKWTRTAVLAASGTITTNVTVGCSGYKTAGVLCRFNLDGAGTEDITFTFQRSVDGSVFETTPKVTYAPAANGTTIVTGYTDITLGGASHLRLLSILNASSANLSNISVTINLK